MTASVRSADEPDYDWIVVGSGFGGSVAALRLAEKGYRVAVLEQGRRYADEDFPESAWQARKLLWAPRLGMRGILRLSVFRHVGVLSGVGVGGGSLVYANTLYQPHSDDFYRHPQWRELADWRTELSTHYATGKRMLGVVPFAGSGPAEALMCDVAADLGVPDGARPTPVAVFFGEPGRRAADPYFGGNGPARTGCVRCGQCMLGCRYGAKNTLVKNYLWLAERQGVRIVAERRVVDIRPVERMDGPAYQLTSVRPGWGRRGEQTLTARGVVLAAGALGTNELLRRCKDTGSLPRISDRLGELVRTNGESIPAATSLLPDADYRSDIAITSSIFPDEHTHITNNTFGAGGNALALTFGPLAAGRRHALARLPRHLARLARIRSWSRRSVIFTVMQSTDTSLRLERRGLRRQLQTVSADGDPPKTHLEIANRVAEAAARRMDGYPQVSLMESFGGAPTSAHFLGGAVIGRDRSAGVVDERHQVFGYPGLLVCDGAAVPANPGVNPSLTILALAERAMSMVPDKLSTGAHAVREAEPAGG